jgi:regulator of RNase E activity RraB
MHKFIVSILAIFGFNAVEASDYPPNIEMNQKTIQALIEAGSNPLKAHPLEHHFYCFTPEALKELMSKGESLGYRVANLGDNEHEGTHYWYGDLIKETVLDIKVINKENSVMLELAGQFGSDYDGWGTPVVD